MVSFIRTVVEAGRRPITTFVMLGLLVLVAIGAKGRVWRAVAPSDRLPPQQLLPVQTGPAEMVYFKEGEEMCRQRS